MCSRGAILAIEKEPFQYENRKLGVSTCFNTCFNNKFVFAFISVVKLLILAVYLTSHDSQTLKVGTLS